MCKKVKCSQALKFVSYLGFGLFGLTGGAFYTDYIVNKKYNCEDYNKIYTPDCYSQHFFGVAWLLMAACVPFFGLIGECKPKITIIGAIIAFLAGIFGLYFVIAVLIDNEPYNVTNSQKPRYHLGHGCIVLAEGLRNGFELLALFAEGNKEKEKDGHMKVKAVPLDTSNSVETPHGRNR